MPPTTSTMNCKMLVDREWHKPMVRNVIEHCFLRIFITDLLDKRKLDLCSEPPGYFSALLRLALWLCAMPPVANGFCFDCSLNLTLAWSMNKSHTYLSLK